MILIDFDVFVYLDVYPCLFIHTFCWFGCNIEAGGFFRKTQSLSFQLIKELPTKSSRHSIQKIPVVQGFGACGSSSRGFRSSSWGFHGHRLAGNPLWHDEAWCMDFSIIIASRILFRMQCIQHLSLSFLGWCHLDAPPPNFNLKCVSLKFAMKFMCILFVCVAPFSCIMSHHFRSFHLLGPRLEEIPLESENMSRLAKLQVPIAAAVRNLHFRVPRKSGWSWRDH